MKLRLKFGPELLPWAFIFVFTFGFILLVLRMENPFLNPKPKSDTPSIHDQSITVSQPSPETEIRILEVSANNSLVRMNANGDYPFDDITAQVKGVAPEGTDRISVEYNGVETLLPGFSQKTGEWTFVVSPLLGFLDQNYAVTIFRAYKGNELIGQKNVAFLSKLSERQFPERIKSSLPLVRGLLKINTPSKFNDMLTGKRTFKTNFGESLEGIVSDDIVRLTYQVGGKEKNIPGFSAGQGEWMLPITEENGFGYQTTPLVLRAYTNVTAGIVNMKQLDVVIPFVPQNVPGVSGFIDVDWKVTKDGLINFANRNELKKALIASVKSAWHEDSYPYSEAESETLVYDYVQKHTNFYKIGVVIGGIYDKANIYRLEIASCFYTPQNCHGDSWGFVRFLQTNDGQTIVLSKSSSTKQLPFTPYSVDATTEINVYLDKYYRFENTSLVLEGSYFDSRSATDNVRTVPMEKLSTDAQSCLNIQARDETQTQYALGNFDPVGNWHALEKQKIYLNDGSVLSGTYYTFPTSCWGNSACAKIVNLSENSVVEIGKTEFGEIVYANKNDTLPVDHPKYLNVLYPHIYFKHPLGEYMELSESSVYPAC